jgi:hypothetical protein
MRVFISRDDLYATRLCLHSVKVMSSFHVARAKRMWLSWRLLSLVSALLPLFVSCRSARSLKPVASNTYYIALSATCTALYCSSSCLWALFALCASLLYMHKHTCLPIHSEYFKVKVKHQDAISLWSHTRSQNDDGPVYVCLQHMHKLQCQQPCCTQMGTQHILTNHSNWMFPAVSGSPSCYITSGMHDAFTVRS